MKKLEEKVKPITVLVIDWEKAMPVLDGVPKAHIRRGHFLIAAEDAHKMKPLLDAGAVEEVK